jgi:rod shape-determining protein MreC
VKNIFIFIRKHFNLLLFLFLQGWCIYQIYQYSQYHQAAFGSISNAVTGRINQRYFNVQQYFSLRKTNDSLLKANEWLYNQLRDNYSIPDTVSQSFIDTLKQDSLVSYRTYRFHHARVLSNAVNTPANYLVLDQGKAAGVLPGMGVIDLNRGVVGIVVESDENYAVVMSMLHKDSRISGKLTRGGETGTMIWDGKSVNSVQLTGVSKSAKIFKQDAVMTSGFSTAFPKGMRIGTVQAVFKETSSNLFRIQLNTAADFHSLQMVYVIENIHQKGVQRMLDNIKSQPGS